jgi:hypothetical protein
MEMPENKSLDNFWGRQTFVFLDLGGWEAVDMIENKSQGLINCRFCSRRLRLGEL